MMYTDGFHLCGDTNGELVSAILSNRLPMKYLIENPFHHYVVPKYHFVTLNKMVKKGSVERLSEKKYYSIYKSKKDKVL